MRVSIALGVALVVACLFPAGDALGAREPAKDGIGLTTAEFRRFAQGLPELPGRIHGVRFFQGPRGTFPGGIAIPVFVEKEGWQVFVFMREPGQNFQLVWRSGKLENTFSASSDDEFRVFHFGEGDIVQFEGCVTHVCPDVFSILIYVPSKRTAFKVHSVHGKTTYSPELEAPENRRYKDWLDKQVKERSENTR